MSLARYFIPQDLVNQDAAATTNLYLMSAIRQVVLERRSDHSESLQARAFGGSATVATATTTANPTPVRVPTPTAPSSTTTATTVTASTAHPPATAPVTMTPTTLSHCAHSGTCSGNDKCLPRTLSLPNLPTELVCACLRFLSFPLLQAVLAPVCSFFRYFVHSQAIASSISSISLASLSRLTDTQMSFALAHIRSNSACSTVDIAPLTFPYVQTLDFSRCLALSGVAIWDVMQHCGNLMDLSLLNLQLTARATATPTTEQGSSSSSQSPSSAVTTHLDFNGLMQRIAEASYPLRYLNLRGTPASDTSLGFFGRSTHCTATLEHLDVRWCGNLSEVALLRFLRDCPVLRTLELSHCPAVTDTFIIALTRENPCLLETLSVRVCEISDDSLVWLSRAALCLPSLRRVDISGCPFLSEPAVAAFVARNPDWMIVTNNSDYMPRSYFYG